MARFVLVTFTVFEIMSRLCPNFPCNYTNNAFSLWPLNNPLRSPCTSTQAGCCSTKSFGAGLNSDKTMPYSFSNRLRALADFFLCLNGCKLNRAPSRLPPRANSGVAEEPRRPLIISITNAVGLNRREWEAGALGFKLSCVHVAEKLV